MITVFLIVSILLPLALWTRPPNIVIGNVQAVSNGSEIQLLNNGVQINLEIPIFVSNPNYFSVSFSSIKANIYYPLNNTLIGSGQENDITFHSHASTNFTFPFSIEYTTTMSSSAEIIANLVTKCGGEGGTASDITVDYDITLALRVLFFTVSPTISNSASFQCPLTASDISSLTSALTGGGLL
jgi:LEA14-like dessication related protein